MRNLSKRYMNHKILRIFIHVIICIFLLVGCGQQNILDTILNLGESGDANASTPEPGTDPGKDSAIKSTPIPVISNDITVWIPSYFDPFNDTESGNKILTQINLFRDENPQATIDVRVKAEGGSSSMLDSLIATAAVAPGALPSVALIARADLELAAERGIIQPFEQLSPIIEEDDLYSFAQDMGIYHGEILGLPFAADAVVLISHDEILGNKYLPITNIDKSIDSIGFAAGDPDSLFPYIIYQSSGGALMNDQGQPTIELEYLANMLSAVDEKKKSGLFNKNLVEYQSDEQIWLDFASRKMDGIITWTHFPLSERDPYFINPVPGLGEKSFTYATGWVWCLINKEGLNQQLSMAFLEHMLQPDFLADWTLSSGLLPVRLSSIDEWGETEKDYLINILESANLVPEETLLSFVKSDIINAVQEVLLGFSTPEESTQKILERLEVNEIQ